MNFGFPYFIDQRIEEALEEAVDPETGEIVDEGRLDEVVALQEEKQDAIEQIGLYYKDIKAAAEAVKAEKDQLAKKQKSLETRAESIKKYLAGVLSGQKFKTPRLSVSYRASETTEIADKKAIPAEFFVIPEPQVDKRKIKEALSKGEQVPGVYIKAHQNVIIK